MLTLFQDLWCVLKKELISSFRDQDVLIYGVLLPFLLYPIAVVGVAEIMAWYEGMSQQHKTRVALVYVDQPASDFIGDALRKSQHLTMVQSSHPQDDLRNGELDAVVVFNNAKHTAEIQIDNSRDQLGTANWFIEGAIRSTRLAALKKSLSQRGYSEQFLHVFKSRAESVAPTARGTIATPAGKSELRLVFVALLAIAVLQMAIVSQAAATCMLADEREKKTFHTTLLLPISREKLMAGKFLAVVAVTIAAAAINFASMILVPIELVMAMPKAKFTPWQFYHEIGLPPWEDVLAGIVVILFSAAFFSAVYLLVTAFARSFKEAQTLLTLPMLVLMLLPLFGAIPVFEFNQWTALVPVSNFFFIERAPTPPLWWWAIPIVELSALSSLCLWLAARVFLGEVTTRKGRRKLAPAENGGA